MTPARFQAIAERYLRLKIGVVGDFCLDRYLEIDPARAETSIETGLAVHNVINVRSQPGAAGTVLNNLVALGIGEIFPVGFCGDDGEGFELERALRRMPGVDTAFFQRTPQRRTFVYCKPLIVEPGREPRELNRLDSKNWTPTPAELQTVLVNQIRELSQRVDALIIMDQVDVPETGVVTKRVREALATRGRSDLLVLADCRRGLADYPPLGFKMNAAELSKLTGDSLDDFAAIEKRVAELACRNRQPVFVTLAERGIVGSLADGSTARVLSHPVRGPIDIVGAGDAVTANLTAAVAAGGNLREAMQIAMAAASIVIHQLGTTGTATPMQIAEMLEDRSSPKI